MLLKEESFKYTLYSAYKIYFDKQLQQNQKIIQNELSLLVCPIQQNVSYNNNDNKEIICYILSSLVFHKQCY